MTTEHLTECPHSNSRTVTFYGGYCVCPLLRACEQRVSKEALQDAKARESNGITWAQAYSAAVADTRDAILSLPVQWDRVDAYRDALAAIDALKEKNND